MSNPSLLCVPYRFKTSKLYSQIPDSGLGDFVVTRSASNSATRVNAAGLIETVADNVPRLDYPLGGITAGCPALLVEPSAQNLALQSADFNTTWSKVNLNVSTNATATPDPAGGNTADLLTVISGSTQAELSQVITTVSGTAYVFSFFGKKGSGATDLNSFRVISSNVTTVTINWDTGVLTQTGTPSSGATAQNFGNGWWRISIPFTAGSTSTIVQVCSFTTFPAGQNSYRWGAQLEASPVPTSYIPTAASPVTRGAETISKTGVSSLIGQTEGTIYAEINYNRTATIKTAIMLINTDGSFQNRIQLYTDSSHQLNAIFSNAATAQTITASGTNLQNGINKIALTYTSASAKLFLNGALQQSFVLTIFPAASLQVVKLGNNFNNSLPIYNGLTAAELYTTMLSDAELQSLTQ